MDPTNGDAATGGDVRITVQQWNDLIQRMDQLGRDNERLQREIQRWEDWEPTRDISHEVSRPMRLKPVKPQPYDPTSKDANVRTWLFSLNNYFKAAGIPNHDDEGKISFAATLLQGAALEWWRQMSLWANKPPQDGPPLDVTRRLFQTPLGEEVRARMEILQRRPDTWEQFEAAIIARFDLINSSQVARDKIKRLTQKYGVQDYTRRFLALCAEIDDLEESEKKDRYFDG